MTVPSDMSVREILHLHSQLGDELRERGILRSANSPTGDLAERLFCEAFGWNQQGNSQHGFDAIDDTGSRYQIKGRRLTPFNGSRQLSAIRNLDSAPFDYLAGLLFDTTYNVLRAAIIPAGIVAEYSSFRAHVNAHIFHLSDSVWDNPSVRDVTTELQAVSL